MKNKSVEIKSVSFLILIFFFGLIVQSRTCFAQSQANEDDAKIYAEVKNALEKFEEQIDSSHQTTAAELQNKAVINFDDLLAKSDLLIRHNPKIPDYYRLRGKARYYKTFSNSIAIFTQSSILSEANLATLISPAEILAGIKDFSDALAVDPTAKLDDSEAADAHLFRGKLYAISAAKSYSKENLQKALADFDEAIKLDGYILPPDDFRREIYLLSKDGDLVGQDFVRRIKEDPANAAQIYLERAGYYSLIVDYSKALADLLRYANSPNADRQTAQIRYATLNKYAGDAYKKSNLISAQDYLAKAALEIQFPKYAEAAFNDASQTEKLDSRLTAAYVIRAKYLVGSGKVDEGMAEAYLALLQDPDNVGALCVRGLGLAIKNNVASLDDFNRAIALDPELAFLYNAFGNRAKIYTALGKTDLAAADLRQAQAFNEKLAEIQK